MSQTMNDDVRVSARSGRRYHKPVACVVQAGSAQLHYYPGVREGEVVDRYFTQSANPRTPDVVYVQTFRTQRRADANDERVRWDCGCADYIMGAERDGPLYVCKHLSARFEELAAERRAARCQSCQPHADAYERQQRQDAYAEVFNS